MQCSLASLPEKAPGQFRILLFSDIHLGLFPRRLCEMLNKRAIGAVNHFFRRRHKVCAERIEELARAMPQISPDVTVCAGDLTSVSLHNEFSWAERALAPILEYSGEHFFYVPGNHDTYVNDDDARLSLENTFSRLNRGRFLLESLPVAVEYSKVRLILLNPARPCGWLLSCGYLEDAQAEGLSRLLDASIPGKANVLVSHFPALNGNGRYPGIRHGLRGARHIADALAEGRAAAVLSGHVHRAYSYAMDNGCAQLCSGSLTLHGTFAVADFLEGRLQRHFIVEL